MTEILLIVALNPNQTNKNRKGVNLMFFLMVSLKKEKGAKGRIIIIISKKKEQTRKNNDLVNTSLSMRSGVEIVHY